MLGLSGGVDSSVAAMFYTAIGASLPFSLTTDYCARRIESADSYKHMGQMPVDASKDLSPQRNY